MSTEGRSGRSASALGISCGLVLALGAVCAGAAAVEGLAAVKEFAPIPLDEIRAGMTGHGLSVFAGTTPERFEVEVLGVLRNLEPDASFVLARLTGQDLEKTGIIAGMSGSPVYLDGRLAGAVAFSFPFAEEAIAGITPIASMRAIGVGGAGVAAAGSRRGAGGLATAAPSAGGAPDWRALVAPDSDEDRLSESLARLAGFLDGERSGMLWSASGFGESARARLGAALPNFAPLAGGVSGPSPGTDAGGAAAADLEPGDSVAAIFVDGDLRLAATGTVTDRDGDRVLAFGHAVTGLGDISLPLAASEVITVFPSALSSFKLASSGRVLGAFESDRPAGVAGRLGIAARTIPVELEVAGARRYALSVASVPQLLATLVGISTYGAWDAAAGFAGARSVDLAVTVELDGRAPLELEQSFDGAMAPNRALGYLIGALDFVSRNDLAPLAVTGVKVTAELAPEPRSAQLVAVRPSRTQIAPGDELELQIELRTFGGGTWRESVRVRLPPELPDGRYALLVGDGVSVDAARLALAPAPPATLDQVLEIVGSLRSTRDLAIVGVLPAGGLSVAGELLPRLPGSMRSIWSVSGVRGASPVKNAVLQNEARRMDRPLAGMFRVELEIRREPGRRR